MRKKEEIPTIWRKQEMTQQKIFLSTNTSFHKDELEKESVDEEVWQATSTVLRGKIPNLDFTRAEKKRPLSNLRAAEGL